MKKEEIETVYKIILKMYKDDIEHVNSGFMFIASPRYKDEDSCFQLLESEILFDEIADIQYLETGLLIHTHNQKQEYNQEKAEWFDLKGEFHEYYEFLPYEAIAGITTQY